MKKLVVTFSILLTGLFTLSLFFVNCSGKKTEQAEETVHHQVMGDSTGHEDVPMDSAMTAYTCPMHPEIIGKEGDKCSKCGMKLVPVKADDQEQ